jgi:hypothetical protein
MKKTLQLTIVLLIFSCNTVFSQSKFSFVSGVKYYNYFSSNKVAASRLGYGRLGIFAGAAYDITKRNKIAAKTTVQSSKKYYLETNVYEFGLYWRYAFVKRNKIDVFAENGIGIWHTKPFDNVTPLNSSVLSSSGSTPTTIRPASNTATWIPSLGMSYHMNKSISLALQYEHYIFLKDKYNVRNANTYALSLSMECHF